MTFIFREVTTGNTSHGVRRLVEHAISLLNSLGPSSALGEKGKKKKNGVKQQKNLLAPSPIFSPFPPLLSLITVRYAHNSFLSVYWIYVLWHFSRKWTCFAVTFLSGKTQHCCVDRQPIDGGEIQTRIIKDWLFLKQVYRVTAPFNAADCFDVIDDQKLRARWWRRKMRNLR